MEFTNKIHYLPSAIAFNYIDLISGTNLLWS